MGDETTQPAPVPPEQKQLGGDSTAPEAKQGFGRRVVFDLRDHDYLAREKLVPMSRFKGPSKTSRFWGIGPTMDQGQTPQCVAFSTCHLLQGGPVKNLPWNKAGQGAADYARWWFGECLKNDEWEGEDPNFGTSGRASMKVGKALGFWPEYVWSFDVDSAADFIIQRGPALFGTIYPDSMQSPDAEGFVSYDGDSTFAGMHADGHEYYVFGVSKTQKCPDGTKGCFYYQNTWGNWSITYRGQPGVAKLPFSLAAKLFAAGGDCMMPTEIKVK